MIFPIHDHKKDKKVQQLRMIWNTLHIKQKSNPTSIYTSKLHSFPFIYQLSLIGFKHISFNP